MMKIQNIKNRISVRSFKSEEITKEIYEKIEIEVNKKRIGPFGNIITFELINTKDKNVKEIGKLTSYGVIKGASIYIGGCCNPDTQSIIDYGFCFEELILELTALDIGTCWLGGTFGRGFISKVLKLPKNQVIPAISPIGIKRDKSNFTDRLVRRLANSDNRKPDNQLFFSYDNINGLNPINMESLDLYIGKILNMIKIGPSASNKQPWRVVVHNKKLQLFWDKDLKYNSMSKTFDIQALDMGIAICHIIQSSNDLGYKATLEFLEPTIDNNEWVYITTINLIED